MSFLKPRSTHSFWYQKCEGLYLTLIICFKSMWKAILSIIWLCQKKTMALIQEIWESNMRKRAQGLLMNLNEKERKGKYLTKKNKKFWKIGNCRHQLFFFLLMFESNYKMLPRNNAYKAFNVIFCKVKTFLFILN